MGVLKGNYKEPENVMAKMQQKCKPDYEAQIQRIKEKLQAAQELKKSIFSYQSAGSKGLRSFSDALTVMVGELEIEISMLDETIAHLIEQQEADK